MSEVSGFVLSVEYYRDRVDELEAEVERLKSDYKEAWATIDDREAKIEAALAEIDKRLERTRSWSDVRTHDERNALRSIHEALRGGRE